MIELSDKQRLSLYFAAAFLMTLFLSLLGNEADYDLWGRMAMGALIVENQAFPYRDVFSYTTQLPWIDHEWGSGVVFYLIFAAWGSAGLLMLKLLLQAGILGVLFALYGRCYPTASPAIRNVWLLFLLVMWSMMVIISSMVTIRCHMFSLLGFSLFLWFLESARTGQKLWRIWLLPVLMLLWANLHGGFVMGLVALGVYWVWALVERQWDWAKKLAGVGLLCLLATVINPYGLDYHRYLLSAWLLPRREIGEWNNIFHFNEVYAWLYTVFLGIWLVAGLTSWLKAPRKFPGHLLLLALVGIKGWMHLKLAPFFILAALALGGNFSFPSLPQTPLMQTLGRQFDIFLRFALPVTLCLGLPIATVYYFSTGQLSVPVRVGSRPPSITYYPLGATTYLKEHGIRGRLWCPFDWGEFLLWNLYPEIQISMDGRYEELYPEALFQDSLAFYAGQSDLRLPDQYQSTHLLVPSMNQSLIKQLAQDGTWTLVYRDKLSLLYQKAVPSSNKNDLHPAELPPTRSLNDFRGDFTRFKGRSG